MTDEQLLQEFEALIERLGIHIARVDLEGRSGGLCRIHGERRFILDRDLDPKNQIKIIASALARLPLDDIFVLPRVRDAIDAFGKAHV